MDRTLGYYVLNYNSFGGLAAGALLFLGHFKVVLCFGVLAIELAHTYCFQEEYAKAENTATNAFWLARKHPDRFPSEDSNAKVWAMEVLQEIEKGKGLEVSNIDEIERGLLETGEPD